MERLKTMHTSVIVRQKAMIAEHETIRAIVRKSPKMVTDKHINSKADK